MSVEVFKKGGCAPEKHPSVPVIVTRAGVDFRDGKRGLFSEAPHRVNRKSLGIECGAHALNIAETGFGTRRRNAENDHAALAASDFKRSAHDDAIALGI